MPNGNYCQTTFNLEHSNRMTSTFSRGLFNSLKQKHVVSFQFVRIILRFHLFPVLEHARLKFHRKCQFKKKQNRNPENPRNPPRTKKTMAILRRHLCQTSSPVKFENHPGIERFQPQKAGSQLPHSLGSNQTKRLEVFSVGKWRNMP